MSNFAYPGAPPRTIYYVGPNGILRAVDGTIAPGKVPAAEADSVVWTDLGDLPGVVGELLIDDATGEFLYDDATGDVLYESLPPA